MHFTTRHRWITGNLEAWQAIFTDQLLLSLNPKGGLKPQSDEEDE